MRLTCLAQENKQCLRPWLEAGLLTQESRECTNPEVTTPPTVSRRKNGTLIHRNNYKCNRDSWYVVRKIIFHLRYFLEHFTVQKSFANTKLQRYALFGGREKPRLVVQFLFLFRKESV